MKAFLFVFAVLLTCCSGSDNDSATCSCEAVQLCVFYDSLDSYLQKKGLLNVDKDSYYKLIKAIENETVVLDPIEIWKREFDMSAALLIDHDHVKSCVDSLYRLFPRSYSLSRFIENDFQYNEFTQITDADIKEVCTRSKSNQVYRLIMHELLWGTILDAEAKRLTIESRKGRKRMIRVPYSFS
jgi:hypothetical protein